MFLGKILHDLKYWILSPGFLKFTSLPQTLQFVIFILFKVGTETIENSKHHLVNTWTVLVLRHGAGILKWITDELENMDRKLSKIMMMYGVFHTKSDKGRLYLTRANRGQGLISCESCALC